MNVDELIAQLHLNLGFDRLPEFVYDEIREPNLRDILDCAENIEPLHGQDVPVQNIVGLVHRPFNTWLEFLTSDLRWDRDKFDNILMQARLNPRYYEDSCDKDGWSFTCIDGLYYTQSGHHRTAVVKLMEAGGSVAIVKNVMVDYIRYDADLLHLTITMRKLFKGLGDISGHRTKTGSYLTFKPKFRFSMPLQIDAETAREFTRKKAILTTLRVIPFSCYIRIKEMFFPS